ncbi:hypothetical protein [Deinococcus deserti]|uniref:Uncharacterized protein n=1 Tax=Deinococcus deserti (strain DSM 17065 / CIP 109153 / LMG 22923 / VCD115) TaxID=546414 RepID=C1D2N5_DEIDV|nr:hypothetical protein [Deinococcus deserti]ACO47674.2 Hypothetical protein Deide_2p00190 [Deinococcus deserti VCD115]
MNDSSPPETGPSLLDLLIDWQEGTGDRHHLIQRLTQLGPEQGAEVQKLIQAVQSSLAPTPRHAAAPPTPAQWRTELMACRARVWPAPDPAGLLVGPEVMILTDGHAGTILRDHGARTLPSSVAASLMLLCQTIIMAQHAVDAQELGQLQQQRITANSTSLSDIEPVQ